MDIEFVASCSYDSLSLFESGRLIGTFCGDGGDRFSVGSPFSINGPVRLEFKSDTSQGGGGFDLTYEVVESDPCSGIDCSNRGECQNGICICQNGFVGEECEVNVDECAPQPCSNGNCIDL